jgi:hypothetical protein
MSRHYYQIVASLREVALDSQAKGFDAAALRDTVAGELAPPDRELLRTFYAFYDTSNLIELKNGRTRLNPLGHLAAEELEERLREELKEPDEDSEGFERRLWRQFYDACERSDNDFIRKWYAFDRQLRNICAAWTARKTGRDIAPVLVGNEDINRSLANNPAADFGLKTEVDYIEPLVRILENTNLIEKERALDRLRWQMADELTEFDYFNLDKILAWCVKAALVQRWTALDATTGNAMFRQWVEELTASQSLENKTT